LFLYRNQALSKDLIHGRLKASGARVGVPIFAHKLRHTCATQLLNAGCPITSIQQEDNQDDVDRKPRDHPLP
jgi:integrase